MIINILKFLFSLLTLILICAYFWLTRPFSQFGIGSHQESFDGYVLRIPYGWATVPLSDLKNSTQTTRGLTAVGSLWCSNCSIGILSPAEIEAEHKRGEKFPFMHNYLKQLKQPIIISPATKITINNIPFEKVSWSIKVGDRQIGGFEYQSIPNNNEDTIRIEATQGFGLPSELDQAEYIVKSLKRKAER